MANIMYAVWYGDNWENEALFTKREDAETFAKAIKGYVSRHKWSVEIAISCLI